MKVLHVSYFDNEGGACRASFRLHSGLRAIGVNSNILSLRKKSSDAFSFELYPIKTSFHKQAVKLPKIFRRLYIDGQRIGDGSGLFSICGPGFDISQHPLVQEADVINLHWISGFLTPNTIGRLKKLGKPIVWTLHDQWAFTGGCHYTFGCEKYLIGCDSCPQLKTDRLNLVQRDFESKKEHFSQLPLTIVTPSRWMAHCAKQSAILGSKDTHVIPYSINTEIFSPTDRSEAKYALDVAPDCFTILFGAESAKERRKGFDLLMTTLQQLRKNPDVEMLIKKGKLLFWSFGGSSPEIEKLGIPFRSFGYVNDDRKLAQIYSASNLVIVPSYQDNYPNLMIEAMSCGSPVAGFAVGGLKDLVTSDVGMLAPAFDTTELAKQVARGILDPKKLTLQGQLARERILALCPITREANDYLRLYESLLSKSLSHEVVIEKPTQLLNRFLPKDVVHSGLHP